MEQSVVEKDLSERLFGKDGTTNLKHLTAPLPLISLCYKVDKGFMGDDLGMFAKSCNEFFPSPTYQGICLTSNTDIKEVMKIKEDFNPLFDSQQQKSNQLLKSDNTLVFFTGVGRNFDPHGNLNKYLMDQTDFRTLNNDKGVGGVQFNLHQSIEFAHFFSNAEFFDPKTNSSLNLKAGYEYFIDVTPYATLTTDAFNKMSFSQRKCKLQYETEDNSIFKIYTVENCQYECYIKMAEKLCHCIPWDFMHNTQASECDLFGRTCFYNTMERLGNSNETYCKNCIKECDYTTYEAIVTKQNEIAKQRIGGSPNLFYGEWDNDGTCKGQRAFCDFLLPINGSTILDQGLANAYDNLDFYYETFNQSRVNMLRDMVIVHLRILKPHIQLIDAKYSILDKFANFGGNFGIFAEITGCSFLGVLNFFIILFKFTFSHHQNAD